MWIIATTPSVYLQFKVQFIMNCRTLAGRQSNVSSSQITRWYRRNKVSLSCSGSPEMSCALACFPSSFVYCGIWKYIPKCMKTPNDTLFACIPVRIDFTNFSVGWCSASMHDIGSRLAPDMRFRVIDAVRFATTLICSPWLWFESKGHWTANHASTVLVIASLGHCLFHSWKHSRPGHQYAPTQTLPASGFPC